MFKGKINQRHLEEMGENTGAVTVSSLSYKTLKVDDRTAVIKITAAFHPTESWTRYPKLTNSKVALEHEKRHFDICEIYARKLRQLVSQTRFSRTRFNDELNGLFKKVTTEQRNIQELYDHETDHSIDEDRQLAWNRKIDAQLNELANYTETIVTVQVN
ncbi:MAG: hypothetical protein M3R25_06640 [Bacteroidota bacterium]|nr:hypothetical protein [Bacteroidota bacterium]